MLHPNLKVSLKCLFHEVILEEQSFEILTVVRITFDGSPYHNNYVHNYTKKTHRSEKIDIYDHY